MTKTKEKDTSVDKKKLCHFAKTLSKGTKGSTATDFMLFNEGYSTLRKMIISDSSRIAKAIDELNSRWIKIFPGRELPCMENMRRLPDVMLAHLEPIREELSYIYRAAANGGKDPDARKKAN